MVSGRRGGDGNSGGKSEMHPANFFVVVLSIWTSEEQIWQGRVRRSKLPDRGVSGRPTWATARITTTKEGQW